MQSLFCDTSCRIGDPLSIRKALKLSIEADPFTCIQATSSRFFCIVTQHFAESMQTIINEFAEAGMDYVARLQKT